MWSIRNATINDLEQVTTLSRKSFEETLGISMHSIEEGKIFFRDTVFKKCTVLVAEMKGEIVGFIGYRKGWIDHLRVDSRYHGQGIGKSLLARAKEDFDYLQLWCFQHIPARGFYKKQGYIEVELTDGSKNEERLPDVRMEWKRDRT